MSQSIHHGGTPQSTLLASPDIAPFRTGPMEVEAQWIDYNGHLNMAYYNVLFDRGIDEFVEALGVGPSYVAAQNATLFTLDAHLCYLREIMAGDRVFVDTLILDHDHKRVHFFQTLVHEAGGFVSATSEQVAVHVDLATRRSAPFPGAARETIARAAAAGSHLPRAEQVGKRVGIIRKAE
jgi:acyl-CoA thioester hydrolase